MGIVVDSHPQLIFIASHTLSAICWSAIKFGINPAQRSQDEKKLQEESLWLRNSENSEEDSENAYHQSGEDQAAELDQLFVSQVFIISVIFQGSRSWSVSHLSKMFELFDHEIMS